MKYFLFYLCIINAVSFLLMLIDKAKAKKNRWRIPEATLLSVCAIGGSLGGIIGMYLLRHKTKHPKFYISLPLMLILHSILLAYLRNQF